MILKPSKLESSTVLSSLASARRSESAWQAWRAHGTPVGMLEGVPATIKDLILVKGWPTLRGSRTISADQPWEVDAPVAARLREGAAKAEVVEAVVAAMNRWPCVKGDNGRA